jgi:hypothetical protein
MILDNCNVDWGGWMKLIVSFQEFVNVEEVLVSMRVCRAV